MRSTESRESNRERGRERQIQDRESEKKRVRDGKSEICVRKMETCRERPTDRVREGFESGRERERERERERGREGVCLCLQV